MPEKLRSAIAAWKEADAAARAAERELQQAWDTFLSGKGSQPSPELIDKVAALHAAATERLAASVRAMGVRQPSGKEQRPAQPPERS